MESSIEGGRKEGVQKPKRGAVPHYDALAKALAILLQNTHKASIN